MATGKMTIRENNLNIPIDYGVPAAQLAFELDLSADADIDSQLQTIIDDATEKGVILTGMLTSRKIITRMRRNAQLQRRSMATSGPEP